MYVTNHNKKCICDFENNDPQPHHVRQTKKWAGVIAVLAHSGQQQNFHLSSILVDKGLYGIELNHPSNSNIDRETIRFYADKYHLFLNGGSDFHGEYEKEKTQIGDYLSDNSGIEKIMSDWIRKLDKIAI